MNWGFRAPFLFLDKIVVALLKDSSYIKVMEIKYKNEIDEVVFKNGKKKSVGDIIGGSIIFGIRKEEEGVRVFYFGDGESWSVLYDESGRRIEED